MKKQFSSISGLLLASAIAGAVGLAGCSSSPDAQAKNEMAKADKQGQYFEMHEKAKAVLAEPDKYSEETVALAKEINSKAVTKLTTFYGTNVNHALSWGDARDGIKLFEAADPEVRANLKTNVTLQKRLMRAYVTQGDFDTAREAAELILENPDTDLSRDEANLFLSDLAALPALRADAESKRPMAETYMMEAGIQAAESEKAVPSCSFQQVEQEAISPEKQKVIDDYYAAKAAADEVYSRLVNSGLARAHLRDQQGGGQT